MAKANSRSASSQRLTCAYCGASWRGEHAGTHFPLPRDACRDHKVKLKAPASAWFHVTCSREAFHAIFGERVCWIVGKSQTKRARGRTAND